MKSKVNLTIVFLLIAFTIISPQNLSKTIFVANWNVENLFDTKNDPNKNDEEFLPNSYRHWTLKRLNIKLKHLAKVIRWMNNFNGPDLLSVEEVEHKALLDTLIKRYFPDKNYKIAYAESPDKRGIDNGLIYNADIFKLIKLIPLTVNLPSKYPTRYILWVTFLMNKNDTLNVFVNHWPSRLGGRIKSQPNRIQAAEVLRNSVNLIFRRNPNSNIIIIGDFNDNPDNISITDYLDAEKYNCPYKKISGKILDNLSYTTFKKNKGTFLYRGTWDMLDQIIVSNNIVKKSGFNYICGSLKIIKPEFLIEKTGRYKGSALPTYGGRKYLGGYSDHFPVGAKFEIVEK